MPIRLLNRRISCFTLHQVLHALTPLYYCNVVYMRVIPPFHCTHRVYRQATPLRCDVIVGCEDGLLGCIMGCGGTSVRTDHAASDDRAAKETSSHGHHSAAHATAGPANLEARASAAAALERMICVATSDDAALQSEDAVEAAAAAVAAAEACDAGVFRAVRVHDAAVLCAGVMSCASSIHTFITTLSSHRQLQRCPISLFVLSCLCYRYDSRVVFMSGGADGRLVMCRSSYPRCLTLRIVCCHFDLSRKTNASFYSRF
jgi:hypothetical protein